MTDRTRTVRWAIHVRVPPAAVYRVLDSDEGRARFWAESAMEQDGAIQFRFINGLTHRARVLRRDAPREWSIEYFGTPATFHLEADGQGGTDVRLTHENIAPEDWDDVHAGWLNVLLPLKAWLQHGVDIRNHDAYRTWERGYVDQ